ncbi:hypothetical protein D9613_000883 [Agrocybe pediades]|uniref:Uncharacterized protein n=1 Tax=Agrocybe pediades TaxID=84607 RepID=A0A8H4VTD7_9AGAR|nr:hypothetical protein D9613_000883 [Agrocybe pediades]
MPYPYPAHETQFIGSEYSQVVDMDLCDLLQTMRLDPSYAAEQGVNMLKPAEEAVPVSFPVPQSMPVPEEAMALEDVNYHSDTASESSDLQVNPPPLPNPEPEPAPHWYGCAYLQVIQSQLDNCQTTCGEYLDVIFTHREILYSYPGAHTECARAFTDMAYAFEKRAWRSDREADVEAVTSFRHEAWVIASSLAPVQSPKSVNNSSYVCHGMPMM